MMQDIFIEDPFSINCKNDWDTPEAKNIRKPKLNIMLEGDSDDDEGFLADLDAMIEAGAKENPKNEKIEILGSRV